MIVVREGRASLLVRGGSVVNGAWEIEFDEAKNMCWPIERPDIIIGYDYLIDFHPNKGDYNQVLNDTQDLIDKGLETRSIN